MDIIFLYFIQKIFCAAKEYFCIFHLYEMMFMLRVLTEHSSTSLHTKSSQHICAHTVFPMDVQKGYYGSSNTLLTLHRKSSVHVQMFRRALPDLKCWAEPIGTSGQVLIPRHWRLKKTGWQRLTTQFD